MEDEFQPVVIDNGTHRTKIGFAGQDNPHDSVRTVVGRPRMQAVQVGLGSRRYYTGDGAWELGQRGRLTMKYPIDKGLVTNFDDLEQIWHNSFFQDLRVAPEGILVFV